MYISIEFMYIYISYIYTNKTCASIYIYTICVYIDKHICIHILVHLESIRNTYLHTSRYVTYCNK